MRLLRLLVLLRMFDRSAASNLAGRVLVYTGAIAVMSVSLRALAVLDAEQNAADATITTFGNALWWACTTVTTVGYGDFFPVTLKGRVAAVVLMVVGIGLVGTVTASVPPGCWPASKVSAPRQCAPARTPHLSALTGFSGIELKGSRAVILGWLQHSLGLLWGIYMNTHPSLGTKPVA